MLRAVDKLMGWVIRKPSNSWSICMERFAPLQKLSCGSTFTVHIQQSFSNRIMSLPYNQLTANLQPEKYNHKLHLNRTRSSSCAIYMH